jgi:hypothetical protein
MFVVRLNLVRPVTAPGSANILTFENVPAGFFASCAGSTSLLRAMAAESVTDFDALLTADPAMGPTWVLAKAHAATCGASLDQLVEATKRAALGS